MLKAPNILILGGTGFVGQRIAAELEVRFPAVRLTVASRSPGPVVTFSSRIIRRQLDVTDTAALSAACRGQDIVVIATGPFDAFGATIHRIAIAAGADVVDINDSVAAARDIVALENDARLAGRRIVTGMGLAPGLSTFLLCRLAHRRKARAGAHRARLYMGALNGGGPSNLSVLLEGFRMRLPVFREGGLRQAKDGWGVAGRRFQFPGQDSAGELMPFASPEAVTLGFDGSAGRLGIDSLDWGYRIQFLPPSFAHAIARTRATSVGKIRTMLERSFAKSGPKVRRRPYADDTTTLVVETQAGDQRLAIHGPVATSHLTAMMASWATLSLVAQRKRPAGVYPLERIFAGAPSDMDDLESFMATRGILVGELGPELNTTPHARFGESGTFDGKASSLRHFGQFWYSLPQVPPKIKKLQQQILKSSRVWKALEARTSAIGRVLFLMRMMRARGRLVSGMDGKDFGLSKTPRMDKNIRKDFALFAAGYSEARKLLGEEALPLYSEMFMASSAMEMAWLWPSPRLFRHADDAEVLPDYLEAYFKACIASGIVDGTCERDGNGLTLAVSRCAYACVLEACGCPELGNLVRDMEMAAINAIARACGAELVWRGGTLGTGTMRLAARQRQVQGEVA